MFTNKHKTCTIMARRETISNVSQCNDKMRNIKLNFKQRQLTKLSKRSLLYLAGFTVVIAVIIGMVLFNGDRFGKSGNPVIFSIDGKKYHESEVNELVKYPVEARGTNKNESAKLLFELLKKIYVAEQLGIKPSDEEIATYQKEIPDNAQDSAHNKESWLNLIAKAAVVDDYIGITTAPGYKGYAFDFYFGQHLQYGPAYRPDGLNDPKLVEQDKNYAKEKADFYHQQLKDNKIKPDEVLKQILSDPRLGNSIKSTSNHSTRFGEKTNVNWHTQIFYKPITSFITSHKQQSLLDVQTGKALVGTDAKAESVDMYYYFVLLEDVPKSQPVAKEEFDKQTQNLKAEYKGY